MPFTTTVSGRHTAARTPVTLTPCRTPIRRPTINDIARAAGVSKGTVSRVINQHAAVAPGTRARLEAVMAELGYEPDPAAQHLSWRTGSTLGLSFASGTSLHSTYLVLFRSALEQYTAPLQGKCWNLRSSWL